MTFELSWRCFFYYFFSLAFFMCLNDLSVGESGNKDEVWNALRLEMEKKENLFSL